MALMEGGAVAVGGDSDEAECYIGTFYTLKVCVLGRYRLILL